MRPLFVALALLFATLAGAATPAEDAALEKRLTTLSAELRCLVCQNQSLADSHAELAIDLKNQVRDMMLAGRTDTEIKAYLTDRYGDFVLYRPPVKSTTWLLWAGPVVLLVLGLLALVRIVRKRQGLVADAAAIPADADVAARAHALLDDPPTPSRSDR